MELFFYINSLHEGGAERVVSVLSGQLAKKGHNVTVITSFRDKWEYPLDESVRRISLEDEEVKTDIIRRNISRVYKLRQIIRSENPEILISFMAEPSFRALVAAIGLHVKTVVSVRTDPNREYRGLIPRLLAKTLYHRADGFVFQTENARGWFPMRIHKKGVIIFNPVSDTFYHADGKPGSKKIIVSVGRLVKEKNYGLMIKAFADVAPFYPDYNLTIFGEGELRKELERQISAAGLNERVILYGQCNNLAEQLKDAHIFVLSSDVEGLPNALMEAMALGLPVISTDFAGGGARDLIEHGEDGLIVPVNDPKALAFALRKLLDDKKYSQQLGRAAKKKSARFTTEEIVSQWIRLFSKLVKEKTMEKRRTGVKQAEGKLIEKMK